jgi:hypothetical protein
MPPHSIDMRTLPPRPLRPDERALLKEWLSAAGDITSAYFAERQSDDTSVYRKIVIYEDENDGPSYLIHAPVSVDAWITLNLRESSEALCFTSLREALNSVRPVLGQTPDPTMTGAEASWLTVVPQSSSPASANEAPITPPVTNRLASKRGV